GGLITPMRAVTIGRLQIILKYLQKPVFSLADGLVQAARDRERLAGDVGGTGGKKQHRLGDVGGGRHAGPPRSGRRSPACAPRARTWSTANPRVPARPH